MHKRLSDVKQIERHHHLLKMLCKEDGVFKQQLIHARNHRWLTEEAKQ